MAITVRAIIPAKQAENVQTTQYTSTNVTTVIDKFSVTNTTANNVTFSAHVVTFGGAAGNGNAVLFSRTIAPSETYLCPELVGQVLESNGFISTLAGAAASLTIRASGRQIT